MESAVLLDTSVLVHALGDESRFRDPCRELLDRGASGEFRAYASVEMIQELVHHRLRTTADREMASNQGRLVALQCVVLSFDHEVMELSLDLIAKTQVRGRDAVHAATAMVYGIERIASTDAAFDGIPGITRVDPLTF